MPLPEMDFEEFKKYLLKAQAESEKKSVKKCKGCGTEKRINAHSTMEERKRKFYKNGDGYLCAKCNYVFKKFKEQQALELAVKLVNASKDNESDDDSD